MDAWIGITFHPVTLNKYVYGNSDPVNHVDPTGNYSIAEINTVLSARKILAKSQGKVGKSLLDIGINKGDALSKSYTLEKFLRVSEAHLACQVGKLLTDTEIPEFVSDICEIADTLDNIKFITFETN